MLQCSYLHDELCVIQESVRSLRKSTKKTKQRAHNKNHIQVRGSVTDDGTIRSLALPSESSDDDNCRKCKCETYVFNPAILTSSWLYYYWTSMDLKACFCKFTCPLLSTLQFLAIIQLYVVLGLQQLNLAWFFTGIFCVASYKLSFKMKHTFKTVNMIAFLFS